VISGRFARKVCGKTRFLSLLGTIVVAVVSHAVLAQSALRLTPEQEAIARRLDGTFIAPCCFANTLAEHRSPIADELRQEIRTMLAGGATETQVVDAFVAKYGERILAAPTTHGFNVLAYVSPAIAFFAGLLLIRAVVGRHAPPPDAAPSPPIPDRMRAQLEAELARFDS